MIRRFIHLAAVLLLAIAATAGGTVPTSTFAHGAAIEVAVQHCEHCHANPDCGCPRCEGVEVALAPDERMLTCPAGMAPDAPLPTLEPALTPDAGREQALPASGPDATAPVDAPRDALQDQPDPVPRRA